MIEGVKKSYTLQEGFPFPIATPQTYDGKIASTLLFAAICLPIQSIHENVVPEVARVSVDVDCVTLFQTTLICEMLMAEYEVSLTTAAADIVGTFNSSKS